MDNGVMSFNKIKINHDFLEEVWKFNPITLGSLDELTVSQYSICLAQYLIFFRSELNQTKAIIAKKKKLLDSSIAVAMDAEVIKKYKTKTAAIDFIKNSNQELSILEDEISSLMDEVIRIDGIDKAVSEYIATFKRELTRREKEIFAIRAERRG
jgi:hypothetical protein